MKCRDVRSGAEVLFPARIVVTNGTTGAVVTWSPAGAAEARLMPGQSLAVPYALGFEAQWRIEYPAPPVVGATDEVRISLVNSTDVDLFRFTLDVGGQVYGKPAVVGDFLPDNSTRGLRANETCTPAFVPTLDLVDLRGGFTTNFQFTNPPPRTVPIGNAWTTALMALVLTSIGAAVLAVGRRYRRSAVSPYRAGSR